MFDEELLNPDSLDGTRKREIAMVAQVQVQEVNAVLRNYKSMESTHKWIRERKANNLPLPES